MYISETNEWNKAVQLAPTHNTQIVNYSEPTWYTNIKVS